MMPAMGAVFALKGATEADIKVVREILDSYIGKDYFDDLKESGEVIATDDFEFVEKYDVGYDLSENDRIKIVYNNKVEGEVYYNSSDRHILLSELAKMVTGYKIVDVDYMDYSDVFKRGCSFFWADGKLDDFITEFPKFLNRVTEGKDTHKLDIFFQTTDVGLAERLQLEIDHTAYNSIDGQLISTDSEDRKYRMALFVAG